MTFMLSLLAQTAVVEPVQAAALEAQTAVPPLNLWSLSLKGGFIMIPIVLLSLVTIYIFVERLLVLRDAARQDDTFMQRIKDYIHAGRHRLGLEPLQEKSHTGCPSRRERHHPPGSSHERCAGGHRKRGKHRGGQARTPLYLDSHYRLPVPPCSVSSVRLPVW